VHYEKGGIDRPSRSPLMMSIQLTEDEKGDLIAFMETLTEQPQAVGRGSYERLP
jgi:cytochrome c peroxidase